MSEQYAFAIGFDDVESDEAETLPGINWKTLYEQVATAIQAAGLPPLDSERWDEFGQGRIFWGTKSECDVVKQVLAPFRIYVEEARNLETGYYATPTHTYFVCDSGTIYILPPDFDATDGEPFETTDAIPLDAYRLKGVDPELDWAWQKHLRASVHEKDTQETFQPMAETTVEPVDMSSLQDQSLRDQSLRDQSLQDQIATLSTELEQLQTLQTDNIAELQAQHTQQIAQHLSRISELEGQVSLLDVKVNELQGLVNTKIDPQVHADLQYCMAQQSERLKLQTERSNTELNDYKQRLAQQNERVLDLERQLAQAEIQLNEWKLTAAQTIDADAHANLQQQLGDRALQVQDLQQRLQHLEEQLRDAEFQSAQKVDLSRYNALEQDVTDKVALINDLRRTVQQLERDLGESQTVAEAKVEWSEYQAVQDELKQFKLRRKKGLLGRLFG